MVMLKLLHVICTVSLTPTYIKTICICISRRIKYKLIPIVIGSTNVYKGPSFVIIGGNVVCLYSETDNTMLSYIIAPIKILEYKISVNLHLLLNALLESIDLFKETN